jgi:hypothetical protein
MEKIFKLIAQMVGMVILAGLLLLVLWGIVKLFIFLITIFSIVIGFALALIIAVGLIVVLFQTIKELLCGKDTDKKKQ